MYFADLDVILDSGVRVPYHTLSMRRRMLFSSMSYYNYLLGRTNMIVQLQFFFYLVPQCLVGTDTGHKGLMPGVTPRLTGHNARNAPGILG